MRDLRCGLTPYQVTTLDRRQTLTERQDSSGPRRDPGDGPAPSVGKFRTVDRLQTFAERRIRRIPATPDRSPIWRGGSPAGVRPTDPVSCTRVS